MSHEQWALIWCDPVSDLLNACDTVLSPCTSFCCLVGFAWFFLRLHFIVTLLIAFHVKPFDFKHALNGDGQCEDFLHSCKWSWGRLKLLISTIFVEKLKTFLNLGFSFGFWYSSYYLVFVSLPCIYGNTYDVGSWFLELFMTTRKNISSTRLFFFCWLCKEFHFSESSKEH